jgi:adenosylcobinamide kinase / adenosylcobinamide-phosphate guanylyltransferase
MSRDRARTLVLGGAASGKSAFAERLADEWTSVVYVATADPIDAEMEAKIAAHRARRPEGWQTVEVPGCGLIDVLANLETDLIMVDSLTLYVARVLESAPDPLGHLVAAVEALGRVNADLLVVSDEVGMGLVPETAQGRAFRDLLGQVNQRLAVISKNVYFVAAGLAMPLKETRGGPWA